MWNFFTRETFPYEISVKDDEFIDYSVFTLYKGSKKSSGEVVSIFTYDIKGGGNCNPHLENARATVKRIKTLKHPSILTFIDSYEDGNFIHLVTNHVVPLMSYLKRIENEEVGELYLKWGLSTICDAVLFLHKYELRHNNIFHGAVFVDDTGSWKLGEVGYISDWNAPYPHKPIDNLTKYNSPNKIHSDPCVADYWGLGILIWEVFNGELNNLKSLLQPRKIPTDLSSQFLEITKNCFNRPELISQFIERCTENNLLSNTLDGLEGFQLKDKFAKGKISKDLLFILPKIPKDVLLHKIMKLLKQAFEFDAENFVFFVPVISKIPSLITEEEFQNYVEQFVMKLFSSNDRATRFHLLMNIEEIINKTNKRSINELFTHVSTGFSDSNSKIRGETVKAFLHFAPKLSKKQLNDEALRSLLQIQTKDPEPYIRTNTTICLGKVAHCLHPDSRKKILLTAFLNALRDPYPVVRNAGVQAFAVTHRYFPLEMIAKNILPGLVCVTVDEDSTVRKNAFKTIKVFLSIVEKWSESPDLKEELEKDVMSHNSENISSWSSWSISAIASKLVKPTEVKTKSTISEYPKSATSAITDDTVTASPDCFSHQKEENTEGVKKKEDICKDQIDDDGWKSDDWWEDGLAEVSSVQTPITQASQQQKKNLSGPMKLGTRINKNI